MTTYVLAGGCFWCLDAVFRRLTGVEASVCGFAGDSKLRAHYHLVAFGLTKHAEAVEITFDESVIPKETILDIFMFIHDPTSLNQQGADKGAQYRSAMFFADESQQAVFQAAIDRAQKQWDKPIVTSLEPLTGFYPAGEEHQDYFAKQPDAGYCQVVISPKLAKARQQYRTLFTD